MPDLDHIPQSPATAEPPSAPAISDAIEKLLAHPELLSTIASTIGLGKSAAPQPPSPESPPTPDASALPVATPPAKANDLGDAVAALAPLLGALSGKGGPKGDDPRTCLLRALKPYVSHGRAEAIDTIIQLSRVSEVLKKLS